MKLCDILCNFAEVNVIMTEVLRVPGSPQPDARRVRGSWRDYLDPAADARIVRDCLERRDFFEVPDTECLSCDSSEFEPFSEDELSDMDLTLFEPGPNVSEDDACTLCCSQCQKQRIAARRIAIPSANIYMLTPTDGE